MAGGLLKVARFIFGVTGWLVRSSGLMRENMNMPVGSGGSQAFSRPSGRMTGIRRGCS